MFKNLLVLVLFVLFGSLAQAVEVKTLIQGFGTSLELHETPLNFRLAAFAVDPEGQSIPCSAMPHYNKPKFFIPESALKLSREELVAAYSACVAEARRKPEEVVVLVSRSEPEESTVTVETAQTDNSQVPVNDAVRVMLEPVIKERLELEDQIAERSARISELEAQLAENNRTIELARAKFQPATVEVAEQPAPIPVITTGDITEEKTEEEFSLTPFQRAMVGIRLMRVVSFQEQLHPEEVRAAIARYAQENTIYPDDVEAVCAKEVARYQASVKKNPGNMWSLGAPFQCTAILNPEMRTRQTVETLRGWAWAYLALSSLALVTMFLSVIALRELRIQRQAAHRYRREGGQVVDYFSPESRVLTEICGFLFVLSSQKEKLQRRFHRYMNRPPDPQEKGLRVTMKYKDDTRRQRHAERIHVQRNAGQRT